MGAPEFVAVMMELCCVIAAENFLQTAVRAAIGMEQQDDPVRAMEPDGFFDLSDEEVAVRLVLGRRQRFGSTCDDDRIRVDYFDALQKLSQHAIEAVIEARHDDRIAVILLRGRVKVEYAFQAKRSKRTRTEIFARSGCGYK